MQTYDWSKTSGGKPTFLTFEVLKPLDLTSLEGLSILKIQPQRKLNLPAGAEANIANDSLTK